MKFCSIYFQVSLLASSGLVFLVLSAPSGDKAEQTSYSAKRTPQEPKEVNCSAFPGVMQPMNLKNSAYYLLKNGSLCCPKTRCPSSEADMLEECGARGIVPDPCQHCKTCAKSKGEACNGNEYSLGFCSSWLSCINVNASVLKYEYDEGVCTNDGGPPSNLKPGQECAGKFGYLGTCQSHSRCQLKQDKDSGVCVKHAKTNALNQTCGGAYGLKGRCDEGLRCTADEQEFLKGTDIEGVCYKNATVVCFKNCSTRAAEPVCGDNGRWFDNVCFLRQGNCPLLPHQGKIRKAVLNSICGDLPERLSKRDSSLTDSSSAPKLPSP